MTIIVTPAEIEEYRSQLQAYPEALKGLDTLADCEGDLECAAETVAIELGKLDDDLGNEDEKGKWLEKFTQSLHPHICTPAFREVLTQGFAGAIGLLIPVVGPPTLIVLVIVYISRKGLDEFCKDC